MRSKDEDPWNCVCFVIQIDAYMFYSVSLPYLLVFDDDRVRNTRE